MHPAHLFLRPGQHDEQCGGPSEGTTLLQTIYQTHSSVGGLARSELPFFSSPFPSLSPFSILPPVCTACRSTATINDEELDAEEPEFINIDEIQKLGINASDISKLKAV